MKAKSFIFMALLLGFSMLNSLLYGVEIEFVRINPGTFMMGEGDGAVEVTIAKGFDIGKYELT